MIERWIVILGVVGDGVYLPCTAAPYPNVVLHGLVHI